MALDWSQCPAMESIPGKVSGAWVFRGTRMPVATVFENLEAGATIDEIMQWFERDAGTGHRSAQFRCAQLRVLVRLSILFTRSASLRASRRQRGNFFWQIFMARLRRPSVAGSLRPKRSSRALTLVFNAWKIWRLTFRDPEE